MQPPTDHAIRDGVRAAQLATRAVDGLDLPAILIELERAARSIDTVAIGDAMRLIRRF